MPLGLAEKSVDIIFPSAGSIREEIPIWMKFYCYEYSTSALGRSQINARSNGGITIPTLSKLKMKILVPAPANFESTTQPKYTTTTTLAQNLFPPNILTDLLNVPEFLGKVGEAGKFVKDLVNKTTVTGLGNIIDIPNFELQDLVYRGGGSSRNYEIRLYLPCVNLEDSLAAGKICRAFEALSLPSAVGVLTATSIQYFHPPLWYFGIGPADSLQIDKDWSGSPQISVLTMTKIRKQALDTNTIAAHSNKKSLDLTQFKPVAYSLTLQFRELESAIRVIGAATMDTSIDITNRSGVISGGGIAIPPTP